MPKPLPTGKPTGPPPQVEKRAQYLRLMGQGLSNSDACRQVGVNRKTGQRWRHGRIVRDRTGREHTYAPITTTPKERSPRFLSQDEHVTIGDGVLAGRSLRSIAGDMGRSPSTISREVNRNRDPVTGFYQPFRAESRAAVRRSRARPGKLADSHELREFVQTHLDHRWSPEQIAELLPVEFADRPDAGVSRDDLPGALHRRPWPAAPRPDTGPPHRPDPASATERTANDHEVRRADGVVT